VSSTNALRRTQSCTANAQTKLKWFWNSEREINRHASPVTNKLTHTLNSIWTVKVQGFVVAACAVPDLLVCVKTVRGSWFGTALEIGEKASSAKKTQTLHVRYVNSPCLSLPAMANDRGRFTNKALAQIRSKLDAGRLGEWRILRKWSFITLGYREIRRMRSLVKCDKVTGWMSRSSCDCTRPRCQQTCFSLGNKEGAEK
jgi:hypothetical protein